ncbi:MAG: hypothetical protein Q7U34_01720 [Anaerolineales bacterium]|nr:hypothetical protein [Anaerolineales bacterium]
MFVTIVVLNTQVKSPDQVLLGALITKMDTSILLFFFRQLNDTSRPFLYAIKNLLAAG